MIIDPNVPMPNPAGPPLIGGPDEVVAPMQMPKMPVPKALGGNPPTPNHSQPLPTTPNRTIPLELTYVWMGTCPTCYLPIQTLRLEVAGKLVIVAYCQRCSKNVAEKQVRRLGVRNNATNKKGNQDPQEHGEGIRVEAGKKRILRQPKQGDNKRNSQEKVNDPSLPEKRKE